MNEKKITGVRAYVLTVDSETNTVLKCEEEDPNTHHRTELDPNFKVVPAQYPVPETLIPAGFVPSIVILVGGQVSAVSQSAPARAFPRVEPHSAPARAFAQAAEVLDPNFKVVPAQYPVPETLIPAGFVPSIVILVGGQVSAVSQSLKGGEQKELFNGPQKHAAPARAFAQAAEDKQADKGGPPKV